jgi:PKD repeat protein
LTGAPSFNGFEFVLYYDPAVIKAMSTDTTGALCDGQVFKDENLDILGTIRVAVVKLGGACSGTDGTLIHINFNIITVGVSPLTLAAGTAVPSFFSQSHMRLVLAATPIAVETSDGYFKNVSGKSGPVADFAFIPTHPEEGNSVTFDAQASFDPDNDLGANRGIMEYRWDFDDGTAVSVNTPTTQHLFQSLTGAQFFGNFSVLLTVVDSDGFLGMKTMLVEVSQRGLHDAQVFSLTANPPSVAQGESVLIFIGVRNAGTFSEMFRLLVVAKFPVIPIANITGQILPNQSQSFTFTLDTSLLEPGFWTIEATITAEMDDAPANNQMVALIMILEPQHAHDLAVTEVFTNTPVAVSGQIVRITVKISNHGLNPETFDVTAYYDSQIAGTVTGVQIPAPSIVTRDTTVFVAITWNTTGVAPSTYTISATAFLAADEYPSDNTLTDGQLRIDPPPTIVVSPASGSVGTRTTVEGSGFPRPSLGQELSIISLNFDGVSVGFAFSADGTFSFTFNLPHAQAGLHQIRAFDPLNEVGAVASFLVLPSGGLEVTVRVGEIYFRGDTIDIYVLASLDGSPVENSELRIELSLITPDGSTVVLQATSISTGLFKAVYQIPANGVVGTYTITARAHHANTLEASTLRSFEVKPSWLQAQGPRIASAAAVAGLAGFGAVAWRRGYIGRRKSEPTRTS